MKVYKKRMGEIRRGEIVAGHVKGWWKVTAIDINQGSVVLTGVNTATGETGPLQGNVRDVRDLAG